MSSGMKRPPFDPEEERRGAGAIIWAPIGVLFFVGLLVLIF